MVAWLGAGGTASEYRLRFDGQQWWLQPPGVREEVQVMLRVVIDLMTGCCCARSRQLRAGVAMTFPLNRAGRQHLGQLRATLTSAPTRPHG